MKYPALFAFALSLITAPIYAAQPSGSSVPTLTNFNQRWFKVDPHATSPTNVVKLNIGSSGAPDLPGTIIYYITNTLPISFGMVTNYFLVGGTNILVSTTISGTNETITVNWNPFVDKAWITNLYVSNLFASNLVIISNIFLAFTNSYVSNLFVSNLFATNFSSGPFTITNGTAYITGPIIYNGTNTDLTQLWTNSAGTYRPITLQSAMTVTNLNVLRRLKADNAFIYGGISVSNAIVGEFDEATTNKSFLVFQGVSANPDDTWVRLHSPLEWGQQFSIVNNSANGHGFKVLNGDATWDDPTQFLYLSGGDWISTNRGDRLDLFGTPMGWSESRRTISNTNIISSDMWHVVAGMLQPVDLTPQFLFTNQVNLGPGQVAWAGVDSQLIFASGLQYQFNAPNLSPLGGGRIELDAGVSATSSVQQTSPSLVFRGEGWHTVGAASEDVYWAWYVNPYSGATHPTADFMLVSDIGAGLVTNLTVSSASGWDGSGTKFFADDGKFKVITGSSGVDYWTNLAGVLQPVDLSLPVLLTNRIYLGPGTTNVFYRGVGNTLSYSNGLPVFQLEETGQVGTTSLSQQSGTGVLSAGGGLNLTGNGGTWVLSGTTLTPNGSDYQVGTSTFPIGTVTADFLSAMNMVISNSLSADTISVTNLTANVLVGSQDNGDGTFTLVPTTMPMTGFTGFTTNGVGSLFVTNKLWWSSGVLTNVTNISF